MPSLSSTYLIPAILLNPAFVLHLINTFVSHLLPSPPASASVSPHAFMQKLGPVGTQPYLDMHTDDQLCWSYTAIMVFVQILAFGRVQDNRVKKKSAKAARVERDRVRKEKLEKLETDRLTTNANGKAVDGLCELLEEDPNGNALLRNGSVKAVNGKSREELYSDEKENTPENDASETDMTETSEEEMMI